MLVETRQSGSMLIKANGNVVLAAGLYPLTDEEPCTGEVRVLVDRVGSLEKDGKPIIKRVLSVGPKGASAQVDSIQAAPDDVKLSEFVRVHAEGSEVIEFGKPIPLIDIGTEKFELVME